MQFCYILIMKLYYISVGCFLIGVSHVYCTCYYSTMAWQNLLSQGGFGKLSPEKDELPMGFGV